ncbi:MULTISPECIES: CDI toxin immunity protein [unclassified Bacillus (in: firmicutes)]|uniref:CDI toxin immunity protein n=1 Tax=unclassified Bacillus (in: firmicutes) TaxID=185979 RepID=UPI0040415F9A
MDDRSSRQWKLRQKLRALKTKNNNDTNPLFSERLESLGNETLIFSQEKSQQIAIILMNSFPITVSGRIDWEQIDNQFIASNKEQLISLIRANQLDFDEQIFIIWDNYEIPVVSTNLDKVFQSLVDVDAASFYYWILDKELIRIGFR